LASSKRKGTITIGSGSAGQKCCCRHRQTGSRSRAMSGGAAFVSSRAPEPWDDESDRDEDEDEQQPSFVLEVVAGPERKSLCLDDAADDCDAYRCRPHRFCQPSRQHRQSWTTTQRLSDSGQHFLRTTRANHRSLMPRTLLREDLLGSSEWHRNGMISQVPRREHSVAGICPPRPWRSSSSSSRLTCAIASLSAPTTVFRGCSMDVFLDRITCVGATSGLRNGREVGHHSFIDLSVCGLPEMSLR